MAKAHQSLIISPERARSEEKLFRSPLRYPGGKQKAIEAIGRHLPRHVAEYREAMVGGGSVFFHARSMGLAESYWLNDKFEELSSFYLTVQDEKKCRRLMRDLKNLLQSFKTAEQAKAFFLEARQREEKDAYKQALLFFFFNRVTFSGTTRAGGFSRSAAESRFTLSSIERLEPMPLALENVRITCLDFESLIKEPGDDVFIFLDPPYYTASKLYGKDGSLHSFDHEKLASLLQKTKHRFLITYDDCLEVRKLYRFANIKGWSLQYGMNNCSVTRESKIGNELFIANYPLK